MRTAREKPNHDVTVHAPYATFFCHAFSCQGVLKLEALLTQFAHDCQQEVGRFSTWPAAGLKGAVTSKANLEHHYGGFSQGPGRQD